jgi:hypothetical protein
MKKFDRTMTFTVRITVKGEGTHLPGSAIVAMQDQISEALAGKVVIGVPDLKTTQVSVSYKPD